MGLPFLFCKLSVQPLPGILCPTAGIFRPALNAPCVWVALSSVSLTALTASGTDRSPLGQCIMHWPRTCPGRNALLSGAIKSCLSAQCGSWLTLSMVMRCSACLQQPPARHTLHCSSWALNALLAIAAVLVMGRASGRSQVCSTAGSAASACSLCRVSSICLQPLREAVLPGAGAVRIR